jgi:hypothetical protein
MTAGSHHVLDVNLTGAQKHQISQGSVPASWGVFRTGKLLALGSHTAAREGCLPGQCNAELPGNQFAPGNSGTAVFSFKTAGAATDYGWVSLKYTTNNQFPTGITASDINYESSSTPEPSTGALAILAAGAAGVTALRRRKKAA